MGKHQRSVIETGVTGNHSAQNVETDENAEACKPAQTRGVPRPRVEAAMGNLGGSESSPPRCGHWLRHGRDFGSERLEPAHAVPVAFEAGGTTEKSWSTRQPGIDCPWSNPAHAPFWQRT